MMFTHAVFPYKQTLPSIEVPVRHIFSYNLKIFGKDLLEGILGVSKKAQLILNNPVQKYNY